MKKKLNYFCFSLLLFVSITTFSAEKERAPCSSEVKLNDKMYLALGIGYDSYRMLNKVKNNDNEVDLFFSMDPRLNLPGMIGEIILGYGRYFPTLHNTYLGMEIFANGSAADTDYELNISDNTLILDADIVVNGGYGINLLPGVKINNISLLYLKLGYNWSLIRIEETIRDTGWSSTEYDTSITTTGWSYGIGLESAFNEYFSLRGELDHTEYHAYNTKFGTKIFTFDTQYLLALVYHFG